MNQFLTYVESIFHPRKVPKSGTLIFYLYPYNYIEQLMIRLVRLFIFYGSDCWRWKRNCYIFLTILLNADCYLNFYEVIKSEIRSVSFECQRKISRVFAFEAVPSLKAAPEGVFLTLP